MPHAEAICEAVVPDAARKCVAALGAQLRMLKAQILEFDRRIISWHRSNETSKRLDEIPSVGPALATALVASVGRPKGFPIRTGFFGLDRAGAQAEPEQRQEKALESSALHASGGLRRQSSISPLLRRMSLRCPRLRSRIH